MNRTDRELGARCDARMKIVEDYTSVPPFVVEMPVSITVPLVFNAPHSGTVYRRDFIAATRLDRQTLRRSEDTFVDALFAPVADLGAPLMRANFPRAYLDLNRDAAEIDPTMFDGPLSVRATPDTPRVTGGLGVIARVVGERQEIYGERLPADEAARRLAVYYEPYHATLAELLNMQVERFGSAILVDCHSMPSGAVRTLDDKSDSRPDVILGDRYGTSCRRELTERLARELTHEGLKVGRNRPYAGGFITEHFGRPPVVEAVQIEINRALYMNEATYRTTHDFSSLQAALMRAIDRLIAALGLRTAPSLPLAAE